MTEVNVNVQENPFPVLIDTGSPRITVTDSQAQVTVIQAQPVTVTIADGTPRVIIGGGTMANTLLLLEALLGKLSISHFTESLALDLQKLEALWLRIGDDLLLTLTDGESIQAAGRLYTDQSIVDLVADINVDMNGKFDAAYSYIEQTASSIDQRVVSITGELDARLITAESQILQTANSITLAVSRLDNIDGPGGSFELLQSSINQTADSLTLEVLSRQQLGDDLLETSSNLALLTDSIALMVTSMDTLEGRMTASEIILGVDGINLSVLETSLGEQAYTMSTMQTLLTNQWGVTISEDVSGNVYTSGFTLLVHPIWTENEEYVAENTVTYNQKIYECILGHTSSASNAPEGTEGSTYWVELSDGVKSEFTVQADAFKVWTPSGVSPVFTVTEGQVSINGSLVIGPTSLSEINATEYNTLNTAYSSAVQAIFDAGAAQTTADSKITTFYQVSTPTAKGVGDLWYNSNLHALYRWSGSSWFRATDDTTYELSINEALEYAKLNGQTFINNGYVRTDFLHVITACIANAAITTACIDDAAVNTFKIAGNAVTVPFVASQASDVHCSGTTKTILLTVSNFNTYGGDVLVIYTGVVGSAVADEGTVDLELYRGATRIMYADYTFDGTSRAFTLSCIDMGATGTHNYYAKATGHNSGDSYEVGHQSMSLMSARR